MSNTKLEISYEYPTLIRRHSIIRDAKSDYSFHSRPSSGYSADTRFFSKTPNETPRYVVKRVLPKKIGRCKTQEDRSKLFAFEAKEFDKERQKWDTVYTDKPATLVIHEDYGPRLILPFLPGKTLNWWLNNIEHRDTLTESRIWLALAYAFKNLASKGLYPSDIIGANVLVDRQEDGSFQAYVIDFGGVSCCDYNIGTVSIGDAVTRLTGHEIDIKDCKNYEVIISRIENHITSILDAQQSLLV